MKEKSNGKSSLKTSESLSSLTNIRKKFYYYLERSRPGGWLVTIVFLLLGEWYSLKNFPFRSTIYVLIAVVGIASAGSWINFLFDRKLDEFAGKNVDFFYENISPKEISISYLILTIISLILLLFINLNVFIIGLLIAIIFLVYSAPPLRLKTRPPLDCIANAFVFGTMPFLIGWMVNDNYLNKTALSWGLIIGLGIIIYYLILSSFDIEKDKEYGIETSCTKLGFKNSINAGIIIFILTIILSVVFLGPFSILTIAFYIISPLVFIIKFVKNNLTLHILLSIIYYLLIKTILLILFLYSQSKIPLVFFIGVLIIGIYVFFLYQYTNRKTNKSKV